MIWEPSYVEGNGREDVPTETFQDGVEGVSPLFATGSRLPTVWQTAARRSTTTTPALIPLSLVVIVVVWVYRECFRKYIGGKHLRRLAGGEGADGGPEASSNLHLLAEVCTMVTEQHGASTSAGTLALQAETSATGEDKTKDSAGPSSAPVVEVPVPPPLSPDPEEGTSHALTTNDIPVEVAEVEVQTTNEMAAEASSSQRRQRVDEDAEEITFDFTAEDLANEPYYHRKQTLDRQSWMITSNDLYAYPALRIPHQVNIRIARILAQPELSDFEVAKLLTLIRDLVRSMRPLVFSTPRHRLPSFMVNRVAYALFTVSNIDRVNRLFPGVLNSDQWWTEFLNILNIEFDLGSGFRATSSETIDFIEECRKALRLYSSGQQLPANDLRKLLSRFFSEFAKDRLRRRKKRKVQELA